MYLKWELKLFYSKETVFKNNSFRSLFNEFVLYTAVSFQNKKINLEIRLIVLYRELG